MAHVTPNGERNAGALSPPCGNARAGFSLMEMIVVVAIIGTLAGVVAPAVISAVHRAREAALAQNLTIMRKLIDDYHGDRGVYPATLSALVTDGYMRAVPGDPVNDGKPEWLEVKSSDGGVQDVHSQAKENGANGVPYSQW
jgi:prepilin-type N-terminal cleavage/methylation domain-containing protein